MAFDWREYLALATWLSTNVPPGVSLECAQRAAIGRAYYAAFNCAREFAESSLGFVENANQPNGVHAQLIAHLEGQQVRAHRSAGKTLRSLRDLRRRCDYDGTFQETQLAVAVPDAIFSASNIISWMT
jgi:uncharacterized protein (UPF0332 family)